MVDTHCHLDYCEPPDGELVARARAAGVTRIATVGTDGPSIERALAAAHEHPGVEAIVGRHPHESTGFGPADLEEIERAAADPAARAIGETGLDYYRDHAPRADQRRAFAAQLELAVRLGLPVAIHTRAAEDDTFAMLREHSEALPAVILHCFSAPDRLEECVERGYVCSFAGNVTYPKAGELQEAARLLPGGAVAGRDRRSVSLTAAGPRQAERAGERDPHGAPGGRAARNRLRRARADRGGERRAGARLVSEPRQASLRRLRRFRVRPNRELGQNFLIDDNLLGVIERAAELDESDVVLEVGGGLGVLSEYLAPRVSHLHVVEVDRSLEPALADALAPFGNTSLHLADAVRLDLGALRPQPTKVVANLPYGVAATVLLKSIAELPGAGLWVAMVQREVGERLAAEPGGRTYGASSVLAQLSCDVRVLRRVPRTVFHPVPNVDSVLVSLRRRGPAPDDCVRDLVHAGFAHRRKALGGSLALAPDSPPGIRDRVRAALERMELPPDARAERLRPEHWTRLANALRH